MNMLMIAPLCDSRGKIRYHIGAQVDVSGLVKDCTDLESLQKLVVQEQEQRQAGNGVIVESPPAKGDEFQELSEMLNKGELETVRRFGGRMHREYEDDETESQRNVTLHKPRLLLEEPTADPTQGSVPGRSQSGKLKGIYQNVSAHLQDYRLDAHRIKVPTSPSFSVTSHFVRLANVTCPRNTVSSIILCFDPFEAFSWPGATLR